ncbi:hypothetical protein M0D69_07665 [Caballeronia sp. SEWSISQ10-4 2]|uniref:hypothetical protein n=1 Tax=Caballeronia sp. SEWSISQ10-4 2 TaxID=2937438 RepID=UPI00264D33EE|nr:hypothetical protein [Caballeronia sp. SEWSISQ10-4 2]MDN7177895.1 hypothetical protein [Caballeronia sp. SEWSISQ10-4 2]
MESTGCVIEWENNATRHKFAAISTMWFVLSSSAANVCAQNIADEDRLIQPAVQPLVSEYETFAARPKPPAIVMGKTIGGSDAGEAASNGRIIVNPVMEQGEPASIQPIASAPLTMHADTTLEKVTATKEASPCTTHTNSVTLWDEIAPPVPAPVPDTATRATPGDVANVGTQRTQ